MIKRLRNWFKTVLVDPINDRQLELTDSSKLPAQLSFNQEPDGVTIDVSNQTPLPVSDGFVCSNDIWRSVSNMYNFSGVVTDLFDDLHSVITDNTANNPKEILIHLNTAVITNVIAIGAFNGAGGQFSNLEIQVARSDGVFTTIVDESGDSTIKQTEDYPIPVTFGFNAMKLRFHTANIITISNVVIPTTKSVVARLQATKPDNTVTDINATQGGNLKISVEEIESDISSNGNTQLNVTPFASTGTEYKIDEATGSFTVVEYEHHEIHSGSHYFICDYSLGEANGATIEFVITTDNSTSWMHSTLDFSASEGATLDLYKDPTGITGGTTITPVNNNGNSLNTSLATVIKDPTSITSNGTRAVGFLAGGGRTSGFNQREREIVLEQDTVYLFRITSLAVSNDIGWCFEWYEHAN